MKKLVNFVLVLIETVITMFVSTIALYTAFTAAIAVVDRIGAWVKGHTKKKGGEPEEVVE